MNKKKFLFDALLNVVSTAVPIIILQLVTLPIVGTRLGGEEYGLVVTLISLFTILSFPFGNVLNNIRLLLDEEYKEKNISGDFNFLLTISLILSIPMIIIGTIYYEGKFSLISILSIIIISCLNLLREYLVVSFRLQLNYRLILVNSLVLGVGYMVGTFLFYQTGFWHLIFIIGYGFSFIHVLRSSNLLKETFTITKLFNSTTYKSVILLGSSLLKNLLSYSDKLIIFPLLGPTAVSIYYTATIVGKIMSMAINPVNGVILSYLARLEKISFKSFHYILLTASFVGVIGYIITIWISPFVLYYLYPDWATESMKYIYVTSATAIINVISSIIHPFILKFNNINWQLVINGSRIIVYIVCTFILFNHYGLIGFCIGILISAVYQLLLMIFIFMRQQTRNE